MGRAGSGHSGGSRSSGGRSSSSRSSGGRRMGSSSSRAGSSSSRAGSSRMGGSYSSHYRHGLSYGYRYPRGSYHGPYRSGGGPGILATVVTVILILFFVLISGIVTSVHNRGTVSSYNRTTLTDSTFDNTCVIDELGWVDSVTKTERGLKVFFDKTGVQPFVYLKAYDPTLLTDADKEAYAQSFYDEYFDNEHTFLVIYFGEADADNDVGYVAHVVGHRAVSVMDAEAIDIFYDVWEDNWFSSKTTDDVIVDSFVTAAKRFMTKSTTMKDIVEVIIIGVIGLTVIGSVIYMIKLQHKRRREEAEETERILNAPLDRFDDNE